MKNFIDAKFEEKLTCGLENAMRNFKSQNWDIDVIL